MTLELVGVTKPKSRVLKSLPALIGPDADAELQSGDSPEGTYHCLISRAGDHLVVWDLGTKGGTFVNGVRVTKAPLKASDTLRLGGTDFSVRYEHGPRRYLHGVRG
jgi:pSer/pThr/pTyr-binding forkhead associated (FHA) protein